MTIHMRERPPIDRAAWTATWATTIWQIADAGTDAGNKVWITIPNTGTWALISAWNPWCQRLPTSVNNGRDTVLYHELLALGLRPQRSRGHAPDFSWSEDGWMIPGHDRALVRKLLRRYDQVAGLFINNGVTSLIWFDDVD